MGPYKLVALDMDGTLLNNRQQISDGNRQAIRDLTKQGIPVVLSTGRGLFSVMPFVEELRLNDPLITVNGSEVWEHPGKLRKRVPLKPETVARLKRLAVQYDTWFWGYTVDGMFNKENWAEDIFAREWLKFGYYAEDSAILKKILQEISQWGVLEITNSHPNNLEVNPRGVSKASGLNEVCALLGVRMSEIVAIGDSLNDLAMIQSVGLGVAMGNSQEEVKRAARLTTLTNEEDGVVKIIREHVLGD
ncbi:Cof-type HAD-IIB family hydrolase [Ferviditalea candida]|uniref:Cof-type HAD-IIB family hydrolase n=1 Tax=Ferviditalea candida TaxID=3108399 RepID=A0ABU5ZDA9_9BACL|nr:Cof-type HAD-IIB family hydrolase [Paenibacillaceae bacterium T2]